MPKGELHWLDFEFEIFVAWKYTRVYLTFILPGIQITFDTGKSPGRTMEALKGHVKFLKKVLYLLIRTYASPN